MKIIAGLVALRERLKQNLSLDDKDLYITLLLDGNMFLTYMPSQTIVYFDPITFNYLVRSEGMVLGEYDFKTTLKILSGMIGFSSDDAKKYYYQIEAAHEHHYELFSNGGIQTQMEDLFREKIRFEEFMNAVK